MCCSGHRLFLSQVQSLEAWACTPNVSSLKIYSHPTVLDMMPAGEQQTFLFLLVRFDGGGCHPNLSCSHWIPRTCSQNAQEMPESSFER